MAVSCLGGCAHASEEVRATTVGYVPPSSTASGDDDDREASAPASRPRLSRTITLGEGAESPYTPSAPPPPPGAGPTVVVNNNVVVQSGYAGGYIGYGYRGGYGSGYSYGRPSTFYEGRTSSAPRGGVPQWGSSGWEGARRTAAPGQTPGIGGNWAPAPSYGPAQMK